MLNVPQIRNELSPINDGIQKSGSRGRLYAFPAAKPVSSLAWFLPLVTTTQSMQISGFRTRSMKVRFFTGLNFTHNARNSPLLVTFIFKFFALFMLSYSDQRTFSQVVEWHRVSEPSSVAPVGQILDSIVQTPQFPLNNLKISLFYRNKLNLFDRNYFIDKKNSEDAFAPRSDGRDFLEKKYPTSVGTSWFIRTRKKGFLCPTESGNPDWVPTCRHHWGQAVLLSPRNERGVNTARFKRGLSVLWIYFLG